MCEFYNLNDVANYWQQVININNWQKNRISKLIVNNLFGTVSDKKLAVLGFAFKANTNDTRNSASIKICSDLLDEGAILSIYDPKVEKRQIEKDLDKSSLISSSLSNQEGWIYSETISDAVNNAHAIIILTEWVEFSKLELNVLFENMSRPSWIFDTRSVINVKKAEGIGFNVWQIGNHSNKNT